MPRTIILVLDSFGIGASLDAPKFGDAGADTFGHIADYALKKYGEFNITNLSKHGLLRAHLASTGRRIEGLNYDVVIDAAYGYAVEQSFGKDTPSGHWEMMGVPVLFDWGYFPAGYPSFPDELIQQLIEQCNLPGILANKHASGTEVIQEFGDEHIKTGKPIVYTSADSVLQIAAHEEYFGLERLDAVCQIARKLVDKYNVGRVIARPFVGSHGVYIRTPNRVDYATPPPANTLLDYATASGQSVIAIGKIADIFAHRGITQTIKAPDNMALFDATCKAVAEAGDNSIIFTNFVDFDSKFGHRRDVAGYAKALEAFDARLPELDALLKPDDLVILSADHGCDPTLPGSDHTREHIPVLAYGPNIKTDFIGRRDTFADIGQTIAAHQKIPALAYGVSFF